MNIKKSKTASLEKRRFAFLQVGLILSCSLALVAFEWKVVDGDPLARIDKGPDPVVNLIPIHKLEEPEKIIEKEEIPEDTKEVEKKPEEKSELELEQIVTTTVVEGNPNTDAKVILHTGGKIGKTGTSAPIAKVDWNSFEVTQEAQFPGDMYEFLYEHISYPRMAHKAGVSGTVFVEFVVGKDGVVRDVKILREAGYGFDEEAVKAIEAMPNWIPAEQMGTKVNVRYKIPVKFQLGN